MAARQTRAAPKAAEPEMPSLFEGRALWDALKRTDPAYVKPITGKQYKGSSPNPTHLAEKLTERLGPAGHGWGYREVESRYTEGVPRPVLVRATPDGAREWTVWPELMHEVRIEFWTRNPATGEIGSVEAYGCTPARYITKRGQGDWYVDEDAPKKSLTDAMTKAMSLLGMAADIFTGRWDDNKYVAENAAHFAAQNGPAGAVTPGVPHGRGVQQGMNDDWGGIPPDPDPLGNKPGAPPPAIRTRGNGNAADTPAYDDPGF